MVQLSHPYMTTGNIIALTKETFVSKVMFLLFNILSGIVISFLSKSKHLLISGLQSLSAVILEDEENNGNSDSDRLNFFWSPKSLNIVTAVMKLKDACSLEEKL